MKISIPDLAHIKGVVFADLHYDHHYWGEAYINEAYWDDGRALLPEEIDQLNDNYLDYFGKEMEEQAIEELASLADLYKDIFEGN